MRSPDNKFTTDFFEQHKRDKQRGAGMPPNSVPACPAPPQPSTPSIVPPRGLGPGELAGIVMGGAAFVGLLALMLGLLVLMLCLLVRRSRAPLCATHHAARGAAALEGGLFGTAAAAAAAAAAGAASEQGGGGKGGDGGGGVAGGGVATVLVAPPSSASSSWRSSSLIGAGSGRLSPQGSTDGPRVPSSAATTATATTGATDASATCAALLAMPQASVVQMFESPFALDCVISSTGHPAPGAGQQGTTAAAAAGLLVAQGSAATTASRSLASGSTTPTASSSVARSSQQAANNNSSDGCGGSGSADRLSTLLPSPYMRTVQQMSSPQRQQQQQQQEDACSISPTPPDSYGGCLVPTTSVPMGRINHALVIPYQELSLKELIGSGAEGKVYRGTWKHTDIAAKEYLAIEPPGTMPPNAKRGGVSSSSAGRAQLSQPSEAARAHARAALAKEVHWLTSLNHPNLVRFCAVCLDPPLVVMEYYKHGSVFAMMQKATQELANAGLQGQPGKQKYMDYLSFDRRLEMLHDVAAGMSYLHGRDHIHGDLRSPNLFVGADGKVKIGDFGFTKRLGCNRASLKVARITHPRWVAPELIMDNTLSRASDTYSFGIIMHELLTLRIPFDTLRKEQVVIEVIKGVRPGIPPEEELPPGTSCSTCLTSYLRLMRECWAQDPAQRPSFEVVARRLKAMQRWRLLISRHSTLQRASMAARRIHSMPALARAGSSSGAATAGSTAAAAAKSCAAGPNGHVLPVGRAGSAPAGTAAPNQRGTTLQSAAGSRPSSSFATPFAAAGPAGRELLLPQHQQHQQRPLVLPQQQLLQQLRRHCVTSIPEAEPAAGVVLAQEEDEPPSSFEELPDGDAKLPPPAGAGGAAPPSMSSLPVSSAVVHGTRLAAIALPLQLPGGCQAGQEEADALSSVAGTAGGADLVGGARRVLLVGSDLPSRAVSVSGSSS